MEEKDQPKLPRELTTDLFQIVVRVDNLTGVFSAIVVCVADNKNILIRHPNFGRLLAEVRAAILRKLIDIQAALETRNGEVKKEVSSDV